MATAGTVGAVDNTGTGTKIIDTSEIVVNSQTVERQNMVIADPTTAASLASVKAASTAALATDPALVVAISPNNPVLLTGSTGASMDTAIGATSTPTNALWGIDVPTASAGAALSNVRVTSGTSGAIKASAGNFYGLIVINGTTAGFLQIYNLAAGSTGSASIVMTFSLAASATLVIMPGAFAICNNATGISWGITTTAAGGTAGTAASAMTFFYK